FPATAPERLGADLAREIRELGQQSCLADARIAGDEKEPTASGERFGKTTAQLGELSIPAVERPFLPLHHRRGLSKVRYVSNSNARRHPEEGSSSKHPT